MDLTITDTLLGIETAMAAAFAAVAAVVLFCGGWPGTIEPRPRITRLQRCIGVTMALTALELVTELTVYGFFPDHDPRWEYLCQWLSYAVLVPIAFGGVLIRQQKIGPRQWLLSLLPFVVYLVLIVVYGKDYPDVEKTADLALYAYILIIYVISCAMLVRWDRRMKEEFSAISHKQSVWYRRTTLPILVMYLLWVPAKFYPIVWIFYFPILIPLLMVLTSRALCQEEFDWKGADDSLLDLLKEPLPIVHPSGESPVWVERLNRLMKEENIWRRAGLTRDELAMEIGVNRTYLSQYINSTTGGTFYDYINDFRLREACSLLTSGDESISSVAEHCGFSNTTTFNRAFRERYGCTPTDYRKQKKG